MAALQNIKIAAQATAKQIRDQSSEILKSGSQQVYPKSEQGIEQPQSGGSGSSLLQTLQNSDTQNLNPEEIKRREQELLSMWRQRLAQITSEQSQATQSRQEQYQAWQKQQAELMTEPANDNEGEIPQSASKPKGPMAQGGKQRIEQQISMKRETGRGAKN